MTRLEGQECPKELPSYAVIPHRGGLGSEANGPCSRAKPLGLGLEEEAGRFLVHLRVVLYAIDVLAFKPHSSVFATFGPGEPYKALGEGPDLIEVAGKALRRHGTKDRVRPGGLCAYHRHITHLRGLCRPHMVLSGDGPGQGLVAEAASEDRLVKGNELLDQGANPDNPRVILHDGSLAPCHYGVGAARDG